jgi:hypothetical protein
MDFESDDPEQAAAYLGADFDASPRDSEPKPGFVCRVNTVNVGAFTIHRSRMPGFLIF